MASFLSLIIYITKKEKDKKPNKNFLKIKSDCDRATWDNNRKQKISSLAHF
jgi:hypothetical protein